VITVPANQYLEARTPAWRLSERIGLVRYDAVTRMVEVQDHTIADAIRRAG